MPHIHHLTRLGLTVVLLTACSPTRPPEQHIGKSEYLVQIYFNGLVGFVPDPETNPSRLWVLLGNAQNPNNLVVHDHVDPHLAQLLYRRSDLVDPSQPIGNPGKPCLGPQDNWYAIDVNDFEDLALSSTGSGPNISGDPLRRFSWAPHLNDVLKKQPGVDPLKVKTRKCLFNKTVTATDCKMQYPPLSARFLLTSGDVYTSALWQKGSYQFSSFKFHSRSSASYLASEVMAELGVTGPLTITRTSLDGSSTLPPLKLESKGGKPVQVRLQNEPKDCKSVSSPNRDFRAHYNLLEDPRGIWASDDKFPDPYEVVSMVGGTEAQVTGPTVHGQCSPLQYSFPP
ncbi:MAG TPA: hypothetical protein VHG32_13050 [Thermoanaerobaculia bacterium]|jgi:hypothetical protein|nr:hypothetical protein [Thermoanaerobaculia bacterium]